MRLGLLSSVIWFAAACSPSGGSNGKSLDGFLAPYNPDMSMSSTNGGTTGGGTTTGGTTGGGTTTGGTTGGGTTTGGTTSGGTTGGVDGGTSGGGTGLDPLLSPAAASGTPCTTPRSMGECPGVEVCRFFTATEGRCEGGGGGLLFDPCTASADCDIIFVCYDNKCLNFCTPGTGECGDPADCVDVGYTTANVGACRG
jgi:hypothetical protein